MALAINLKTISEEDKQEIFAILHQFAEHAKICDQCDVKKPGLGASGCVVGTEILRQITRFPDAKYVPEDWKPPKP